MLRRKGGRAHDTDTRLGIQTLLSTLTAPRGTVRAGGNHHGAQQGAKARGEGRGLRNLAKIPIVSSLLTERWLSHTFDGENRFVGIKNVNRRHAPHTVWRLRSHAHSCKRLAQRLLLATSASTHHAPQPQHGRREVCLKCDSLNMRA